MVSEGWPVLHALSLKQRNFGEKMREQAIAEIASELGDICGEALANDDATFWIAVRGDGLAAAWVLLGHASKHAQAARVASELTAAQRAGHWRLLRTGEGCRHTINMAVQPERCFECDALTLDPPAGGYREPQVNSIGPLRG